MDKKTEILDAAERRARTGGYNGFSFRDVAADVGVKSASVHYHFPTKEDLGEAVADRYVDRMREFLGEPGVLSADAALDRVVGIFVEANETDDLMCLCAVFAAESGVLPAIIGTHINRFFSELSRWLAASLAGEDAETRALTAVAALEGGMIIARARKEPRILRDVGRQIQSAFA